MRVAARARRDELAGAEDALEEAGELHRRALRCSTSRSLALRSAREAAAPLLERGVREQLAALAMADASFEVALAPREAGAGGRRRGRVPDRAEPRRAGWAAARDRLGRRALAGDARARHGRRASAAGRQAHEGAALGGGRARAFETLVFDEIDAGIGGHAARAVGARLRELGQTRQVLCITHLPQIASLGDRHFSIVKDDCRRAGAHDASCSWPSARSSPSSCGCSAPTPTMLPRGVTRGTCAAPPEQAFQPLHRVRPTPARVTLARMASTRPSPSVPVSDGALTPVTRPIVPSERRMVARTVSGPVRSGRRTKLLVKHLVRGDIAIIDHATSTASRPRS